MPKPHTPFQWAGQASADTIDHRLRVLRQKINEDRRIGRSIGLRYHDGKPGVIEGLLSRGDRRVGRVIERVWREGGKFDGWSEHFSFDRWTTAAAEELAPFGVDLDWFTTRERTEHEVLPWDHLDSGLDKEFLWDDWQDALSEEEVADCRWTPCYDCGVCPTMGTEIQIGPTGRSLLPADRRLMARQPDGPPPPPTVQKLRIRYAKRGRLRFASHRDLARTLERALRRAQVPMAFSAGFSPHPKISYLGAAPTGAASEAEYLEIGVADALRPRGAAGRPSTPRCPTDVAVLECVEAGEGTGSLADRIDTSVWRVELPGVVLADLAPAVEKFLASDVVTVAKRTKNGLRDIDARDAVTARRRPKRQVVPYCTWSSGR